MACGCIRGRHGYIDIQTQTPGLRSSAAVSPCRARPSASGLLDRIAAAADPEALTIARHYKSLKSPIPGFGHHLHKPVDPRACKLLELARAEPELAGKKKYAHSNNSQPPSMAAEFTMLYSPAPQPGSGFYRNNRERLTKLEKACGAHAQQLIEEIKALDHKIYEANAIEINRL